jgi:hypothetical protein
MIPFPYKNTQLQWGFPRGDIMKKMIKTIALTALMTIGLSAQAGGGLVIGSISNLANGAFLTAAIGGGLGVASIAHGVNLIQNGKIGWGVFFVVLEEQNVITATDVELLNNADVATKEAFLAIIASDASQSEKEAQLAALSL